MDNLTVKVSLDEQEIQYILEGLEVLMSKSKGRNLETLTNLANKYKASVQEAKFNATVNRPYLERGYANRDAYLRSLADEYNVSVTKVFEVAHQLGEEHDFETLPERLESYSDESDDDDDI